MCLIVYSPNGRLMERGAFNHARMQNSDGIGVMSRHGVEKFLGRKAGKKAYNYLRKIEGTPYGLHFRWRTHGAISKSLCHPFQVPQSDALVMHNGILRQTSRNATPDKSDTALFVERFLPRAPGPELVTHGAYWERTGRVIGEDNKLLVYHTISDSFTLCNDHQGDWIEGLWYSNTYSLPADMGGDYWARFADTAPRTGEFADSMVADCIDNTPSERYYGQVEYEPGYQDDGHGLTDQEQRALAWARWSSDRYGGSDTY